MIFQKKHIILSFLVCLIYLLSCTREITTPEDIDFEKVPYSTLSEYGFYQGDLKNLIPTDRLLEYKPNSELFSDYAEKKRFVWMPQNTTATIDLEDDGRIIFPNQSILVKNFYYSNTDSGQRIIETRLLIKTNDTWNAYAYIWNKDQTEATYEIIGASIPVSFSTQDSVRRDIEYIQPNKNQCKSCHNVNEKLLPIGPKVQHLNYSFSYLDKTLKNQLEKWIEVGYLNNDTMKDSYPCMIDYSDTTKSLDERAKAYLDMNCAHCHTEKGPASTSGLFLNYTETNHTKWGINKPPIAAGIGAGPHKFDIMPGKSDSSIYIFRMESKKPGIMMPELGRSTVHKEGVQLIRDWIDQMDANNYQ